jgi:hypothetical protein
MGVVRKSVLLFTVTLSPSAPSGADSVPTQRNIAELIGSRLSTALSARPNKAVLPCDGTAHEWRECRSRCPPGRRAKHSGNLCAGS